jgi:hypothetical protein
MIHIDRRAGRVVASVYAVQGQLVDKVECSAIGVKLTAKTGIEVRLPPTVSPDYVVLVVEPQGGVRLRCSQLGLIVETGDSSASSTAKS